ncbi:MAG: hydantoinase/oxoprolinase family protein [Candidatus Thermoplasmatota archaeon]
MFISIDIGGTFTDFVVIKEGITHFKVPSTPASLEKAILNGLKKEGVEIEEGSEIFHGTTVATNAFLEREGIETAFVTNKGFEDILFIGRQTRDELYDLNVKKPKPPLKRENTFGISCRLGPKGNVIEDVSGDEVVKIAEEIEKKDLSASVCLLHSYKNSELEKEVGKILEKHDIDHSLSSEVTGEFREYERGMTTLLNAYLNPLIEDYFDSVTEILGKEPYIMKSGGGLERASKVKAVDCLYSGPAGGVSGGAYISKMMDVDNLITFDMGGTSADMAAVIDEEMAWRDEGEIGGFPVQTKMVDIVTVGSGGGSIARKDEGGALRVGPESAGAEPGPVCYGRGGEESTVTDALLLMRYIDPDYFLGGKIDLEIEKTERAVDLLADELEMDREETLMGIFRVANSKMARTMKSITVERGLDPKDFSILAFGGAGPLHAAFLAEELGIKKVIVPPMAGVFSALGMVTGDVIHDHSRTVLTSIDDQSVLDEAITDLKRRSGEEGEEIVLLGLRYRGQSYHLNVPYTSKEETIERFHEEHERKYGYYDRDEDIEVVRVHLEVRKEREVEKIPHQSEKGEHPPDRECLFPNGWKKTSIFYRKYLSAGDGCEGPSVIEDENSTVLVPPKWEWRCSDQGVIIMEERS